MYTSTMDGDTVEKRLLQGTYLDAQKTGFTGTKAEFDTKLKELLENSDNLTDIVPVERGGTGAGTATSALTNLGLVRKNVDWDETGLGNPFFGTGNTNGPDGSLTVGGFSTPLDGVRSLTVAGRANNLWFRTIENNTLGTWRTIYHSGNLPPVYKWAYNYQNGYLVKTDIAVNDTAATMFTATIAGNSYASSKLPIDIRIQGYVYGTGKIITGCSGLNLGYDAIKTVRAFGYEGVLYLWVAQEVRYQSLGFNIVTSYETTSQPAGYNRVVSVTNAAEPATGLTWPVTIPIKSTYNALNVNLATIDWNVRNLNCNGQIVYTPPANQSAATGSQWKLDGAITSGIGSYYVANEGFRWNYVGWGAEPYLAASCLAVSDSLLKYKNLDVWHAGNANLSTVDWAAKKLTLADNISWIAPETGRIDKGMYFKSSTGYGIAGIGATIYNDSTSYLFIGWGLHPDRAVTSLRVGETHFKYKDQNIWHAGNSNLATIDWNAKNITANGILYSISNGDGQIRLANKATGGQASGIWFTKSDSINTPVGGIGGSITSDVFNRIYLGWGDKPWYPENSLAVASEFIKYKNFDIWHAGNFNPASKLDATATAENTKKLFALDDRDIKPTDLYKKAVHAVFADLNQMTGTTGAGADYQDVLVLNTYGDISAGRLNILLFDKSTMEIKHWQAAQGDTEWSDSAKKVIAYTDGTIANATNWTGKPAWIGNSKPTYTGADIKLTGYNMPSSNLLPVSAADTVNAAIGKLEYNTTYNNGEISRHDQMLNDLFGQLDDKIPLSYINNSSSINNSTTQLVSNYTLTQQLSNYATNNTVTNLTNDLNTLKGTVSGETYRIDAIAEDVLTIKNSTLPAIQSDLNNKIPSSAVNTGGAIDNSTSKLVSNYTLQQQLNNYTPVVGLENTYLRQDGTKDLRGRLAMTGSGLLAFSHYLYPGNSSGCSPFGLNLSASTSNPVFFGIGSSGPSEAIYGIVAASNGSPTTTPSTFKHTFKGNLNTSGAATIGNNLTVEDELYTDSISSKNGSRYIRLVDPSVSDTMTIGANYLKFVGYNFLISSTSTSSPFSIIIPGYASGTPRFTVSSTTVTVGTYTGGGLSGSTANLSVSGNITANGSISPNTSSDERFKQNIRPVESAREIVNRLNPVSFNWNDFINEHFDNKDTGKLNYGFIAQEVEKVLPDTIGTIYTDEYKSIDYIQIIPLLAAAIKEQDAIIGEQNEKIGALESRLEILEKSILAGTENNPDENTGTSGNGNAV